MKLDAVIALLFIIAVNQADVVHVELCCYGKKRPLLLIFWKDHA